MMKTHTSSENQATNDTSSNDVPDETNGTAVVELPHGHTADNTPQLDVGESFYRDLLDELADGVYFVDPQRCITLWNKGAERITGFMADDVVGKCCADKILMHVDDKGKCLCTTTCPLADTMQDGNRRCVDIFLHHKDGHRLPVRVQSSPLFDRFGCLIGGIETFQDSSEHQADVERMRKLAKLAFLDQLTGLSNRRYLDSVLSTRFSQRNRNAWDFGLIMIDVDHFKKFNDAYGHEAGDRVLQVVATTLSKNCRSFDSVGRWGGEEFLVVVGNAGAEDIKRLASQLCALVASSRVAVGEKHLSVQISLGATSIRKGDNAQTLINRADALLYQSKTSGRNRVTYA